MLPEPSTLTSAARVIADTLRDNYGQDPDSVFRAAGLDPALLTQAGARYPWASMQRLWSESIKVTGDPCFGLRVGTNIRPTSFHALGYSWLASRTLMESLQRLCRYVHVISTAPIGLKLESDRNHVTLVETVNVPDGNRQLYYGIDAFMVAVVHLCRTASNRHFAPLSVSLAHEDMEHPGDYIQAFDAPVIFEAERNSLTFDKATLLEPLPGDNIDLAKANDRVAERYLESLEPRTVTNEVRTMLVELLPSGGLTQQDLANQMNRSLSTLQRQLNSEGTNYQEIRDETRRALAEEYVRSNQLSLSEIAYLLGFSDQSNFSRAFKRWTGMSPREFRH